MHDLAARVVPWESQGPDFLTVRTVQGCQIKNFDVFLCGAIWYYH